MSSVTRPPGGYAGKALIVDVTGPDAATLPLDEALLRAYLGGVGLAFVFSPLVGTPLTTSATFAVVAKSPLTGMLNDALASSQFAFKFCAVQIEPLLVDNP